MDLEEVIKDKKKIEEDILKLINDFEKKYNNLAIADIILLTDIVRNYEGILVRKENQII